MSTYVELLRQFQQWNPELVQQMNQCNHHFNSENLNPYHAEGDVWTHTVLAYKHFMEFIHDKRNSDFDLIRKGNPKLHSLLAIAILCHDIGKVYCRSSENRWGKVGFFGHSFASIQGAIDFVYYLGDARREGKTDTHITRKDLYAILVAISNHMDFFDANFSDRMLLANNDEDTYLLLSWLNYFDKKNSICDGFLEEEFPTSFNIIQIKERNTKEIPKINIFCGVTGVGKDTAAEGQHLKIVSYDDARIEEYLQAHPEAKTLDKIELYKKAWEYSNLYGINLNNIIKTKVKNSIELIAVCNTNLTRKARLNVINAIGEMNVNITYIVSDSKTIFHRNATRTSKHIDKLITTRFMYNQQVPTLFDFRDSKIKVNSINLIMT